MSTSNIDISDIISEFGANYKKGSQNVKDLRKKILVMNETDRLFARQVTTDTVLTGGTVQIGPVLQAYQDQFTPYGDTTFKGRSIQLYELKIDLEFNPSSLLKSWLGFLAGDDIDRAKWPIVTYMINELIMDRAANDWELSGIFGGVASAVTTGTPKPVQGAINGIKAIMNGHIAAGDTDPIVVGAPPTDPVDFVDWIEEFVSHIPRVKLPFLQDLAMSQTFEDRFKTGMRKKYNMNYNQADIAYVIDKKLKVSGFASHEGSNKIWTTIKGNAQLGVKQSANESVFKVESAKRMVSIMTDFWKGIGIWLPEELYTNDSDLT